MDCEHTDIDVALFSSIARGFYGRGPVPLARVRENDTLAIRQMLDAGAQGVIVPLVNNPGESRRAVVAARYPPFGMPGCCFGRKNNYGLDFGEYARSANENVAVVVMIESQPVGKGLPSRELLLQNSLSDLAAGPLASSAAIVQSAPESFKPAQKRDS